MLSRWMNTAIIATAIIILIGVTQVYTENAAAEKSLSEAAGLEQLLHTADDVIEHADQWVIKWQAEGKGDARAQAAKLAVSLGLADPVQILQTGHHVYRTEGTVGVSGSAVEVLINAADTEQDRYYIIVQLLGGKKLDRQRLLTLHEQVGEIMAESGLQANWNMSVQGMLPTKDASKASMGDADKKTGEPYAGIEAKLFRELHMMEVERYEDTATKSVSYQAAELPLQVQSGPHMINMQLAVHQISGQGDTRVTVGFPVITIEY